jgi:F420-non-reducing hydrogenase iron-sulfur subunit
MNQDFKPKVTLFYCINAFLEEKFDELAAGRALKTQFVKMPCAGMTRDVFLMRAFESGADGVCVIACPEGQCRHLEGNIRARKRVEWVKNILDEIGLDGRRLSIVNLTPADADSLNNAIEQIANELVELGPNPAA